MIPPKTAKPIGRTESFVPGSCIGAELRFATAAVACESPDFDEVGPSSDAAVADDGVVISTTATELAVATVGVGTVATAAPTTAFEDTVRRVDDAVGVDDVANKIVSIPKDADEVVEGIVPVGAALLSVTNVVPITEIAGVDVVLGGTSVVLVSVLGPVLGPVLVIVGFNVVTALTAWAVVLAETAVAVTMLV